MATEIVPSITPEQYQDALLRLSLQGVFLDESDANIDRRNLAVGDADINIELLTSSELLGESLDCLAQFTVTGTQGGSEMLRIRAIFRAVHMVQGDLPQGFAEIFRDINTPVTVFPYFREFLASLTMRMGIPPLTLPYQIIGSN